MGSGQGLARAFEARHAAPQAPARGATRRTGGRRRWEVASVLRCKAMPDGSERYLVRWAGDARWRDSWVAAEQLDFDPHASGEELERCWEVAVVLQRRAARRRRKPYLVHWVGCPRWADSWVSADQLDFDPAAQPCC